VTRAAAALILGIVCAGALTGCGGSGKPRPDLVFVSSRSGVYALYAMNADGSRQEQLSRVPHGTSQTKAGLFFQTDPTWSPDGRSIAFSSGRSGVSQIYVMNADGKGAARRLGNSPADASEPAWSPDGRRIVVAVGDPPHVYVMLADGRGKAHPLGGGGASQAFPAWSPDGTRIAYVRRESGGPATELWVMKANGTSPRRVTNLGGTVTSPAWSPDSTQIAFAAGTGGGFGISVVTLSTGKVEQRTGGAGDDIEPAWSPDGKLIAFSSDGAIATVDAGGDLTGLTNGKDNDSSPIWNPVPAPSG
jgi:TolB protein